MIKNKEKGSITLFVLILCMFIIIILLLINLGIINKNSNQKKQIAELEKKYSVDEDNLESTYNEVTNGKEKLTKTEIEELIDLKTEDLNSKITNLYNQDLHRLTPEDGVTIVTGGYRRIGNIVIVNLNITIDTSKITLSTDINNVTTVAKGLPKPASSIAPTIYCGYPFMASMGGYKVEPAQALVLNSGDLAISVSNDNKYNAGFGMFFDGVYVTE